MDENMHFVWGNLSFSQNRIELLKVNGFNQIYILSKEQKNLVRVEENVVYFSTKYKPFLKMDQPSRVHHFFLTVAPRQKNCKKKKDEFSE